MKFFNVEYASPTDLNDAITVRFKLEDHEVAATWAKSAAEAVTKYSIDDPTRFYGFKPKLDDIVYTLNQIDLCIDTINAHSPVINRRLTQIDDQDTLNYLHHIFEVYHGLHSKQHHRFYLTAGPEVRKALSNLNILIHRCEAISRDIPPMHICTWFGLQNTQILTDDQYQLFTTKYKFGTVFLNYSEVGKTIADLAVDNDQYIEPAAFQPFRRYGADIRIRYSDSDQLKLNERAAIINQYYESHKDFFGPWQPCYADGSIPVAVIDQALDLKDLVSRQYVKSVSFN